MGIDWVQLSRVVPEGAIAIMFAAFVIIMLNRADKQESDREASATARETMRAQWRAADQERQDKKDAERDARFLAALAERDGDWRDYMGVERTRQSEGVALMAKELEHVATLTALNNTLIKEHDTWERAQAEAFKSRRSGDTGPLGTRS